MNIENQLDKIKNLRKKVTEDDLTTVKLCGREKCDELIDLAYELDRLIEYHKSGGNKNYYGENCFLKIGNINNLISFCEDNIRDFEFRKNT